MRQLWSFFRNKRNREILTWIGAGLATAIAAIWAAYIYYFPPNQTQSNMPSVTASCGSVGVGGNVTGAIITAGESGDCQEQKP